MLDRNRSWHGNALCGSLAVLQIKLDGFIEGAVQTARMQNVGISEALSLTMLAVVREVAAHAVKREKAAEIWAAAHATQCRRSVGPRTHGGMASKRLDLGNTISLYSVNGEFGMFIPTKGSWPAARVRYGGSARQGRTGFP